MSMFGICLYFLFDYLTAELVMQCFLAASSSFLDVRAAWACGRSCTAWVCHTNKWLESSLDTVHAALPNCIDTLKKPCCELRGRFGFNRARWPWRCPEEVDSRKLLARLWWKKNTDWVAVQRWERSRGLNFSLWLSFNILYTTLSLSCPQPSATL